MDFSIRPADPARDLPELAAMLDQIMTQGMSVAQLENWQRSRAEVTRHSVAVNDQDAIVGWSFVERSANAAPGRHFVSIATHPDYRQRGIGGALFDDILTFVRPRGLTGATSAWFGFWRPAGLPAKEYEIRFYASHADAVEYGTAFADEATGENAILDKDEATWSEGIRDRRYFFAGPIGTHGSSSVQAKYGGYAIYGNMVLLCEGADPDHSLERCSELVTALLAAS